jgi:CheY-like chemotaxis protein
MIVDDDPTIILMAATLLTQEGLTVVPAENGAACLRHLSGGFRGLILLDVMMPEMDGWSVVKAIVDRGYAEGNIICMMTAMEPSDALPAEYSQYVLGYIRKTATPETLIATVKEYLSCLER